MSVPASQASFVDSTLFPAKVIGLQATFGDDDETENNSSDYQEGWYISYVDILTLLLTLFVILLSMSQTSAVVPNLPAPSTVETLETQPVPQPAVAEIAPARESEAAKNAIAQAAIVFTELQVDTASILLEPSAPFAELVLPATLPEPPRHEEKVDSRDGSYGIPETNVTENNMDGTAIDTILIFPVNSASMTEITAALDNDIISSSHNETNDMAEQQVAAEPEPNANTPWLQQIRDSMLGQNIEIMASKDHVDLIMSDQVLFRPGRADIKTAGGELLSQLATMIRHTDLSLSIEGHTDNMPISSTQFPSNWELSTARATTVTRLLIENNIAAERIRAIGYADTRPRAANDSIEGRARNRRVSIVLHIPEQPAPVLSNTLTR